MKLGWALDCVPPSCWSTLAGSCPPTASKGQRVAHQPWGNLAVGTALGLPTGHYCSSRDSQNKQKIAVGKIEGLKYCSYEGDKNKILQITWVPDSYFVQIFCGRKLWGKSKISFMLGVDSLWSPCLHHWYGLIHPLAAFSYLLNLDSVWQHQCQKLLNVNKIQDKIC